MLLADCLVAEMPFLIGCLGSADPPPLCHGCIEFFTGEKRLGYGRPIHKDITVKEDDPVSAGKLQGDSTC